MNTSVHPLKNQDVYIKELYISMLFACASCDGEINPSEKSYIEKISDSVDCNVETCLEKMYRDFDKLTEAFSLDFTNNNIIYSFVCDAFLTAYSDEDINDTEVNFISKIAEIAKLDMRLFEYFYQIAELSRENSETAYLIAILSRPKSIDFGLFRCYFNFYNKNVLMNNSYIERTLKTLDNLSKAKKIAQKFIAKNNSLPDVVNFLYADFQPLIEDSAEDLEDLCKELKEHTGQNLFISEDDVYWELVDDLLELNHLCDLLFVDIGQIELLGKKMNLDIVKRMNEIMISNDKIIKYLIELKYNI
ncbi:hypothetical protein [Clostridium sp.]|uniref:tellurite resistance TerB family protein n=1 Tax=Clostridium sp. TaxID=1506 RepID=UPI003D6CE267